MSTRQHFPLYDVNEEHDACGVGFVAHTRGVRSHEPLREALFALGNLAHRGAVDADRKTGDGAGVMFQVPEPFFRREYERLSGTPCGARRVAVGVFFLPDSGTRAYPEAKRMIEATLHERGMMSFVWRHVPCATGLLGSKARQTMPDIEQLILLVDPWLEAAAVERQLYVLRRQLESRALAQGHAIAIASFSSRTIVYKGLMIAPILADFYTDLRDTSFETAFAVFHQRYSTNTMPSWALAQPFRMVAHNGEINTIHGNRFWTRVREAQLESPVWGRERDALRPVISQAGSDSASLDSALELVALSGRSTPHAMAMMIPPAWQHQRGLSDEARAFFAYHDCVNEPWDGPAAVVFADGDYVGATLDRNGLRPLRYKRTREDLLLVCSEVGVLDMDEARVVERGRLGPGQMLLVDVRRGRLHHDQQIKATLAAARPYRAWLNTHQRHVSRAPAPTLLAQPPEGGALAALQNAFGYSAEEARFIFEPLAMRGEEPVGSMGDDTPLAILSRQPRLLSSYFKQRFAQVTNPPIDSIREVDVMALDVILGPQLDWLDERPEHADKVTLTGPLLDAGALERVVEAFAGRAQELAMVFPVASGEGGLRVAVEALCAQAEEAIARGASLLILTDRGVDAQHAPIPALLATGAVNHHLCRVGARHRVSLVVQSGEPREVHHVATLIGYGASAVHPYLAHWTIAAEVAPEPQAWPEAIMRWRDALEKGLLKVMAKMGISVLRSYHGAQNFEAIGLAQEVIDFAFTGTSSRIGGLSWEGIAQEALARHARGFAHERAERLDDQGHYRFRRDGELHAWSPEMLRAVKKFRERPDASTWATYRDALQAKDPIALRDLMGVHGTDHPLALEEVEPAEQIARRFTTAAMSLGSLSPETHATLAIAMNRLGGKSNTGEGGEDPDLYEDRGYGRAAIAHIKQVASGRFGVTTTYLMQAREIEIKMAQGSKPGEGGQIPGDKVTPLIARLRRSVPGVPLISPPPHHDIYSIEDLAQLIFDLRQVNPDARICVKLVSETGVGTIAAGVAKAGADTILISGHDGGTGASPLSSIKNAGAPWELGLAEAQQVLVMNRLRDRVVLRADGGLKSGRDVVIAALLGAEEYNFGTAALIALGCRYVRQCHSNTCPVGIATQREELRARYDGDADQLVAFLLAIAQEVRELLAQLGYRSVREIVGRAELLTRLTSPDHPKAAQVDLSALMAPPHPTLPRVSDPSWQAPLAVTFNDRLVRDAQPAWERGEAVQLRYTIRNTDRAVGARLSGQIAQRYGEAGLEAGLIDVRCHGSAGQSFGAWLVPGIVLRLHGEANDYVAKGMGGGEIAIACSARAGAGGGTVIAGNTVLYGATGGRLFIAGAAGERFAVRNSGAQAVVEGVGMHGCEYMTGGVVVILGEVGENFGAGMTGGEVYVYDVEGGFEARCQQERVVLARVSGEAAVLHELLKRHVALTGSTLGREVLEEWPSQRGCFWRVTPRVAPVVAADASEVGIAV